MIQLSVKSCSLFMYQNKLLYHRSYTLYRRKKNAKSLEKQQVAEMLLRSVKAVVSKTSIALARNT
jgi:hypothetical protein